MYSFAVPCGPYLTVWAILGPNTPVSARWGVTIPEVCENVLWCLLSHASPRQASLSIKRKAAVSHMDGRPFLRFRTLPHKV